MALFEIRNLTFTYPEAKTPALQEVNVAIEQGEFIVICGKWRNSIFGGRFGAGICQNTGK